MTAKEDGHDADTTNTKRQNHYTQWHKLTQMQIAKEYKEKQPIATLHQAAKPNMSGPGDQERSSLVSH
jgi:hypothetical protein